MVLWEIALATAYFLGLKTTYRRVLLIQRRLVSPNYPRIRQFLHSKTRTIFDTTLKVHGKVNWILQRLDKMKPSAHIQAIGPTQSTSNMIRIPNKLLSGSGQPLTARGVWYQESRRRLVSSSRNLLLTAYPTVSNLLRRQEPVLSNIHYRQLVSNRIGYGNGVIRSDIMQWLSHG